MWFTKKGVSKVIACLLVASTVFYTQVDRNASLAATVESSQVVLTESGGCLESAYVKWTPVTTTSGYNVYYKGAGESDSAYKQVDNELIRQYSSYCRAEVLGLKKGNYVMKVVPLFDNKETTTICFRACPRGFCIRGTITNGYGVRRL